ncbi:polysaccharide pyruvyl transferase family protein [Bacillus rhizoplanae]|uniref:polysaccharide pyruvyl transferase family protein n=1 Tax=Bacillus rhizoplanae TaxID=2880966 RepID=UPI003D216229
MKKAEIITYHFVPNYGAVLQVYALQRVLCQYVDNVEILDYRPKTITSTYAPINTSTIKSLISTLFSLPSYLTKRNKFRSFEKEYLNLSKNQYEVSDDIVGLDADYVFLGSDQIWNFEITDGFDPVYFGEIKGSKASRVISYAASLGKGVLSQIEMATFEESLKSIDSISVREREAANLLAHSTDKNIEVVLDPTLLLNKEEWNEIPADKNYGEYVLLYTLADYKETREMADKIAKYKGIKVVEISGKRRNIKNNYSHKVLYNAGPLEFLSLIKNAEFVVTDSFHGTAFSVNFNKQFVTIPHKTRGGRMLGLLQKLNLEHRLTDVFDETLCIEKIDFGQATTLLESERNASIKFIEKSLRGDN